MKISLYYYFLLVFHQSTIDLYRRGCSFIELDAFIDLQIQSYFFEFILFFKN